MNGVDVPTNGARPTDGSCGPMGNLGWRATLLYTAS
jgi:hypothetical protein